MRRKQVIGHEHPVSLLTRGSERARLGRKRRTSSASLRVCPFELHNAGKTDTAAKTPAATVPTTPQLENKPVEPVVRPESQPADPSKQV